MEKVYLVGGAVRDMLINEYHGENIDSNDKDYVVVGSTPEDMMEGGYTKVGADFPVFLHPITKDEYALARTERKSEEGHKGFECEWEGVTLMEDLFRRDLTINSIAYCEENDSPIDPCCGMSDIHSKTLRHTSDSFKEDPLRVLRLARLKAQLGSKWSIANETLMLCESRVSTGDLLSLTPERVWKETEKALNTGNFWLYIEVLSRVGYLEHFLPAIEGTKDIVENKDHHPEDSLWKHIQLVVGKAERDNAPPHVIFAALVHDFGKPSCYETYGVAHGHDDQGSVLIGEWCDKWKVPNTYKELGMMVAKYHTKIHGALGRGKNAGMKPKSIMKLFEATGALKNPHRFQEVLDCGVYDATGRGYPRSVQPYPQAEYLRECLDAILNLDTKNISSRLVEQGCKGELIGIEIRSARISKIREVYKKWS